MEKGGGGGRGHFAWLGLLKLLTGPTMSVKVRWQIQSVVSHTQITESVPPDARYLPLGESSTDRQDEVWPFMANSSGWMVPVPVPVWLGVAPSPSLVVVVGTTTGGPSILDRS